MTVNSLNILYFLPEILSLRIETKNTPEEELINRRIPCSDLADLAMFYVIIYLNCIASQT